MKPVLLAGALAVLGLAAGLVVWTGLTFGWSSWSIYFSGAGVLLVVWLLRDLRSLPVEWTTARISGDAEPRFMGGAAGQGPHLPSHPSTHTGEHP